jgi:hypothetical protein
MNTLSRSFCPGWQNITLDQSWGDGEAGASPALTRNGKQVDTDPHVSPDDHLDK